MAITKTERIRRDRAQREMRESGGFDITCTIGRVELGDGDTHPTEAAMQVIAKHAVHADGSFTFPDVETGGMISVHVERERTSDDVDDNGYAVAAD